MILASGQHGGCCQIDVSLDRLPHPAGDVAQTVLVARCLTRQQHTNTPPWFMKASHEPCHAVVNADYALMMTTGGQRTISRNGLRVVGVDALFQAIHCLLCIVYQLTIPTWAAAFTILTNYKLFNLPAIVVCKRCWALPFSWKSFLAVRSQRVAAEPPTHTFQL